ncbi:(2Fe-2S) ferredoxin domain-containing protein [Anabaena sp. UHCC 0399]|uniref:(2Fe-2S) ferredoxin domain-containing protein n=1 Tax=Anabaena sp. UHCC 0399 TaxID=3110238 RepID=UPI002B1FC6F9|nr:(2Fe-2S) ferredoxin domain-containing protein [Anabaena sp. UHCC 0399]MEA5564028.1 (2Fe-2S) ferredoxin domain-containing protein [Anabaena sp. UHCC 0399]
MSVCQSKEVSQFCLEGKFIEFVIKDGYKLKGLLLGTYDGEYYIKLAKNLRYAFDLRLQPGTWLQVVGEKKCDRKGGKVAFKAERVMAATGNTSATTQPQPPKTKATILMCQKSDCMKRGGKTLCQALEAALSDRGLEDQVTIKATGCMKNCKAGPNIVMPDKTRYSRIQADQVPLLMDKHFARHNREEQHPAISQPNLNEAFAKVSAI